MEIEVITAKETAETQLTSDDRRIQISEFIKEVDWLPEQENALVEMEEYQAQRDLYLFRPDIKSLLVRKLLDYDFIIPRIKEGNEIELDFPKQSIHEEYGEYIIPTHERFDIVSLEFKSSPTFMSEWERNHLLFITRYPWDPNNESRRINGSLTYHRQAVTEPILTFSASPKINQDLFDYLIFAYHYNRSIYSAEILRNQKEYPTRELPKPSMVEVIPLVDETQKEFFKQLEKIFKRPLPHNYVSGIYDALDATRTFSLYSKYMVEGPKSIKYDHLETVKKMQEIEQENAVKMYDEYIESLYKLAGYSWLSRDKFGHDYEKTNVAQRQTIAKSFARLESFWKAARVNKCPHVELYEKFRNDPDERRVKNHFVKLSKFFNQELREGIVTCNNCGFDIICSHLREQHELKAIGTNNEVIRAKLNKYYDYTPIFGAAFCKYCGEKIAQTEESQGLQIFSGNKLIRREEIEDELRNTIWSESNHIIRGVMVFSVVQSNRYLNNLSSTIADVIYDNVKKQHEILMKSKTSTLEDVRIRLQLFIVIYIYALLVKIAKDNPKEIKFKGNTKSDLKTIFKDALNLLVTSRQSLIAKIPNVTNDFIKSYLVKAYSVLVKKYNASTDLDENTLQTDQFISLKLDPIYWHTLALKQVDTLRKSKKRPTIADVEMVLGKTIEEIIQTGDPYDRIQMPFKGWIHQAQDPVKTLRGGEPLQEYMDQLREEIIVNSYNITLDYVRDKVFLENVFVEGAINPHIAEYRAKYETLESRMNLLSDLIKYRNTRPYNFHVNDAMRTFVYDPTQLNKIYGKNGHEHKWKLFKYTSGETMPENEARNYHGYIVDILCTVCYESKGNPGKYDPSDALKQINAQINFFNHYEFQCPVPGKTPYHEWGQNNVCKKCKVTPDDLYNQKTSYYNNYKSVFNEVLKDRSRVDPATFQERKEKKLVSVNVPWKHNPGLVIQFVNKMTQLTNDSRDKIYNKYVNLGLSEGYQYKDIVKGQVVPIKDIGEEEYLVRSIKLDSYMRKLIHEYYFVKYQSRVSRMPIDIAIVIGDLEKKSKKINYTQLPDIAKDYSVQLQQLRRDNIKNENAYEIISNFILETLFATLLDILKFNIGETFVKWFTQRVISDEKNYALLSDKEEAMLTQQRKSAVYDTPQAEFDVEEEYDEFDYDGDNEEDNNRAD